MLATEIGFAPPSSPGCSWRVLFDPYACFPEPTTPGSEKMRVKRWDVVAPCAPAGNTEASPSVRNPSRRRNAVRIRVFQVLAATVGVWMAHACPAFASPPDDNQPAEPGRLNAVPGQPLHASDQQSVNQQLANTIASQLRMSGQLQRYAVEIRVEKGTAELTGQVASQLQREEVLRIVQGVPGVERVRDRLVLAGAVVTPVTATTQPVIQEPRPLPTGQPDPVAPAVPGPGANEPLPIFRAGPAPGGPAGAGMPPPPMPPYAWPTYAPYNNYSRVASPELYPYQSWPFIGPMYPFPKIPLGWRSVTLRWVDGHWWYGRTATGHDWWRVRYW
jgi:hypothetical protein